MNLCSSHGQVALLLPTDGQASFCARNADEERALMDLAHAGFVQQVNAHSSRAAWVWRSADSVSDRRLLALLSAFDLRLELGLAADQSVSVAAALREQDGSTTEVFSGTGFRPDDAIRTCLGEFLEFQSWLYRP